MRRDKKKEIMVFLKITERETHVPPALIGLIHQSSGHHPTVGAHWGNPPRSVASLAAGHSVGAIIQIRPHVHAVVGLPTADFDRVWTLAMSGQLRYCQMVFTEPRRRSAHIINISFSNEVEE